MGRKCLDVSIMTPLNLNLGPSAMWVSFTKTSPESDFHSNWENVSRPVDINVVKIWK